MRSPEPEEFDFEEMLGWIDFGCWSALVMAPIIYWLQGPSVSHDQFVVRTGMVVLAAVGGVVLRVRALVRERRASPPATKQEQAPVGDIPPSAPETPR